MRIFPAIDISGGRAVRLRQGDYGDMTVYSEDPAAVAESFKSQGAENLHIVDLDGARDGSPGCFDIAAKIAGLEGLFIQLGGGVRDMSRVEKYLASGISRVILGTAAVTDPEFLKEAVRRFGAAIAVGVDARDGFVAVSGWLQTTGIDSLDFCRRLRDLGVQAVIYTDIAKDGMLSGPNHEVYGSLAGIKGLEIVASGGISSAGDLVRLRDCGVSGAIIGKALYTGALTLRKALEIEKNERNGD